MVETDDFPEFQDQYHWQMSEKKPDLAWQVADDNGDLQAKFGLKVKVSYTNDQLVQNTKMCLEKRSAVGIVMLVKIQEMPEYYCLTFKLSDLAFTE